MDSNELNKIMAAAQKQLIYTFKKEIESENLSDLLPFCFSHFDASFKTKKYTYQVFVNYIPKLEKNQFWEDTESGRQLISIDKKTGEKMIVISNSYEGRTIYKSQRGLDPLDEIKIIQPIKEREIRKTLELDASFFLTLGRFFSRKQKKKLLINEIWNKEFEYI